MTNTLRILELETTYRVPRDHPEPMRLRAEMDDIVRNYLANCCSRAIDAAIDPNDCSVWVIDEIRLDVLLDVHSAPPAELADFWAKKIASAVARVIANGEDGVRVLRFANRAAFLARFLRSLAEDRAWQRWYFSEFASLKTLPRGTAIREALLREPTEAEAVLIELARTNALSVVATALSRTDQELIVGSCAHGAAYSADSLKVALWIAIAAAWKDASLIGLYVRLRTECPAMPATNAAGSADHLERILRWRNTGELRGIVHTMRHGGLPSPQLNADELETAMMIRRIAVAGGAELIGTLVTNADDSNLARGAERYELQSELGAVFVLLVVLCEIPELLALFGRAEEPLRRYLLYILCFHRKVAEAWRDPAVRLAAGIPDSTEFWDLSPIELREVPNTLRERALPEDVAYFLSDNEPIFPGLALDADTRTSLAVCAAVLMREFARRLPALGGSSIEYLWRNVLAGAAKIVVSGDFIEVRLKPRALQIVLQMTGLHERAMPLPGCAPRSFIVRFDES